jgi:hypothetical protein
VAKSKSSGSPGESDRKGPGSDSGRSLFLCKSPDFAAELRIAREWGAYVDDQIGKGGPRDGIKRQLLASGLFAPHWADHRCRTGKCSELPSLQMRLCAECRRLRHKAKGERSLFGWIWHASSWNWEYGVNQVISLAYCRPESFPSRVAWFYWFQSGLTLCSSHYYRLARRHSGFSAHTDRIAPVSSGASGSYNRESFIFDILNLFSMLIRWVPSSMCGG